MGQSLSLFCRVLMRGRREELLEQSHRDGVRWTTTNISNSGLVLHGQLHTSSTTVVVDDALAHVPRAGSACWLTGQSWLA